MEETRERKCILYAYSNSLGLDGRVVVGEAGEEGGEELGGHQAQGVQLPQGIQPLHLRPLGQPPVELIVKQLQMVRRSKSLSPPPPPPPSLTHPGMSCLPQGLGRCLPHWTTPVLPAHQHQLATHILGWGGGGGGGVGGRRGEGEVKGEGRREEGEVKGEGWRSEEKLTVERGQRREGRSWQALSLSCHPRLFSCSARRAWTSGWGGVLQL